MKRNEFCKSLLYAAPLALMACKGPTEPEPELTEAQLEEINKEREKRNLRPIIGLFALPKSGCYSCPFLVGCDFGCCKREA